MKRMELLDFIKEKVSLALNEAQEMLHFRDRVKDRIGGIYDIEIPNEFYKKDIPIDKQKKYIISEIQKRLLEKIRLVSETDYPVNPDKPIAVVVGLGVLKIKSNNKTFFIKVKARYDDNGKNEHRVGSLYVINIYNNRIPTIILWGLEKPSFLVNAHVLNTKKLGWPIDDKSAYFDDKFNNPNLIDLDILDVMDI